MTRLNINKDNTDVMEVVKDKIFFASLDAFFTKILLDMIVIETNQKLRDTMIQLETALEANNCSRYGYVRLKNPSEILALIGMRGLLWQSNQNTNAMFLELLANSVFSATMSRNRFQFLIFCM